MTPLPGGGYRARTRRNVEDSDGTVILAPGELSGGTALTLRLCRQYGRPALVIDALGVTEPQAVAAIRRFVEAHGIAVLNVAGPRASGWREGEGFARAVLGAVLAAQAKGRAEIR